LFSLSLARRLGSGEVLVTNTALTVNDVSKHRTGRTVRTGAKYRSWVLVKCVWSGTVHIIAFD